jgi:hypothetical protein
MTHAGADWQLIVYGGAMHGFTHDTGGPAAPGVAYHAVADARSSAAIQTFLAESFGEAGLEDAPASAASETSGAGKPYRGSNRI